MKLLAAAFYSEWEQWNSRISFLPWMDKKNEHRQYTAYSFLVFFSQCHKFETMTESTRWKWKVQQYLQKYGNMIINMFPVRVLTFQMSFHFSEW